MDTDEMTRLTDKIQELQVSRRRLLALIETMDPPSSLDPEQQRYYREAWADCNAHNDI